MVLPPCGSHGEINQKLIEIVFLSASSAHKFYWFEQLVYLGPSSALSPYVNTIVQLKPSD